VTTGRVAMRIDGVPLKALLVWCGIGLAATSSTHAQSATIFVNQVFDPSELHTYWTNQKPITPISLGPGDTLIYTVSFKDRQRVKISDATLLWPFLLSSSADTLETAQSLTFYGIGSAYFEDLWRRGSGPISFSSLRQKATVNSSVSGGPRIYDEAAFYYDGNLSGAVPEPTSWGMLMAGFGLAGGTLRRQRKYAQKAAVGLA